MLESKYVNKCVLIVAAMIGRNIVAVSLCALVAIWSLPVASAQAMAPQYESEFSVTNVFVKTSNKTVSLMNSGVYAGNLKSDHFMSIENEVKKEGTFQYFRCSERL